MKLVGYAARCVLEKITTLLTPNVLFKPTSSFSVWYSESQFIKLLLRETVQQNRVDTL